MELSKFFKKYSSESIEQYFDVTITRDDVKKLKSDPEGVNKVLQALDERDFVFIGDSDHDCYAADHLNGCFILLNSRPYKPKKIKKLEPAAVVYSLEEAEKVVFKKVVFTYCPNTL